MVAHSKSRSWTSAGLLGLGAVLLVALGMRLGYLKERQQQPDFSNPVIDAGYHDYWARSLAGLPAEPPLGKPDPEIDEHPCLRPPLYPWFLALVYKWTGGSDLAPRILQHGLGLLAVILTWLLARAAMGGVAAWLAAFLLGVHWAPIYFEGELHAPALAIPLLLGLALAAQAALAAPLGRRRTSLAALTGWLGGCASLARPNALLPLVAVGLWLGWRWSRGTPDETASKGRAWVAMLALVAGAGLGIAPATLRNVAASGETVMITSAGGINLYLGNRPGATSFLNSDLSELGLGRFRTCFDYPAIVQGLSATGQAPLSHREVDDLFRSKAWAAITAAPGEFLRRSWRKALLFFGPAEIGHNKEVALEKAQSWVLRLSPSGWFPLLLGLALLGFSRVFVERRGSAHRDLLTLIAWMTLTYAAGVIPFFAAARYRVPILPLLCVAAGSGLAECLRPKERGKHLALRALGAGVLALTISLLAAPLAPAPSKARWLLDQGRAFFEQGALEQARESFQAAVALTPGSASAHFELAITDHQAADLPAAVAGYKRVLDLQPGHAKAAYNLGYLAEQAGRGAQAARYYLESLVEEPTWLVAQAALGRMAQSLACSPSAEDRDGALAERAARRLLGVRGANDPNALFLLAAAQAELGRYPDARQTLQRLVSDPNIPPQMKLAIKKAASDYAAGKPLRSSQ